MQCSACSRSDASLCFYCSPCLSQRLADHYQRRQQLRTALTLVTAKASALLAGSERGAGGRRAFGVKDERELKADKYSYGVRGHQANKAAVKGREELVELEHALTARRAAIDQRRSNLSIARSLLSSLAPSLSSSSPSSLPTPSSTNSSTSLPLSLPALESRLANLSTALTQQSVELSRLRRILARELLSVFALELRPPPAPSPSPGDVSVLPSPFLSQADLLDPFSPIPSSASTFPPSSSPSPPPPSQYFLSSLPLPPLFHLPTLPPQTLEALLFSLSHLVRLLAMYEGVELPYLPLQGCFGPGKAGVRAVAGLVSAGADEGESEGKEGGKDGKVEVYPLCFGSSTSSSSSSKTGTSRTPSSSSSTRSRSAAAAVEDEFEDDPDASSSSSSRRTLLPSTSAPSSSASGSTSKPRKKRLKLVLAGAVALAFDLAVIACVREGREQAGGGGGGENGGRKKRREWTVESLEDLGGLVKRAAGVVGKEEEEDEDYVTGDGVGRPSAAPDPFLDPSSTTSVLAQTRTPSSTTSPSSSSTPSSPLDFPLSFPLPVAYYTALAFPSSAAPPSSSSPRKKGKGGIGGGGSAESSVFVGGEEGEEGEEGDEDEWNFV